MILTLVITSGINFGGFVKVIDALGGIPLIQIMILIPRIFWVIILTRVRIM